MTRKATRRLTAWIALAALLFSALSPAMASALFADRPEILARLLKVPAGPSATMDAGICHQGASGVASLAPPDVPTSGEDSGHAAHGLYCSFCLASTACTSLPVVGLGVLFAVETVDNPLPAGLVQPLPASVPFSRHPRGPPSAMR